MWSTNQTLSKQFPKFVSVSIPAFEFEQQAVGSHRTVAMMRSAADVSMGGESKHEGEDEQEMGDVVPPMPAGFSTPRRRQQQASGNFEFSVTPEPSRRRLSSSRGRQPPAGLEESPARYSPSKVKAAVRSFADFLHFLVGLKRAEREVRVVRGLRANFSCLFVRLEEQEEHQQEHTLMPVIIQRFAELGAVIESQKRHIDRWKVRTLSWGCWADREWGLMIVGVQLLGQRAGLGY